MRISLIFAALLAASPALAQKAEAPSPGTPATSLRAAAFGEVLFVPPAFATRSGAPDHTNQTAQGFLAEWVSSAESVQAWTRLQTVTANPGPGAAVPDARAPEVARATLERLQGLYRNACSGVLDYQELSAPPIAGARATAAAWVSCGAVGQTGRAEDVVALIVVTPGNVFSVQLATRGAAIPGRGVDRVPGDWQARLALMAQTRLCLSRPGEAPPYPSCS